MLPVLVDCDPGHDDAIAIMSLLAYPEKYRLLGITTVAGNQTLEKVTNNILALLDHLGVSIPVAAGCAQPLRRPHEPQPAAHGESGMDGPVLAPPCSRVVDEHAVAFLAKCLQDSEEPCTILALAPLTNLAVLLQQYPDCRERINRIVLMGGSLTSGNILPKAEFNIYQDPDAAAAVFSSGIPLDMCGLEICEAASIGHEEYQSLRGHGPASDVVCGLLDFFCRFGKERGFHSSPVFDLTAAIYLMHPEIFTTKRYHIDIETEGTYCRGMTVADTRTFRETGNENVQVPVTVDRAAYLRIFLDSIRRLDEMLRTKGGQMDGSAE